MEQPPATWIQKLNDVHRRVHSLEEWQLAQKQRDTAQDMLIEKLSAVEQEICKERRMGRLFSLSLVAVVVMVMFGVDARYESSSTASWHIKTKEMPQPVAIALILGYMGCAGVILLSRDEVNALKGVVEALKGSNS